MQRLLEKIGSSFPAKNIPVKVEAYATFNNCFPNVKEKMSRDGGEIIYGWKLHSSIMLIEAERHAVWKSPDDDLIDVTPNTESADVILFVQESNGWVYTGDTVDNLRINRNGSPLVDDFILLAELIAKLFQTSTRKSSSEVLLLDQVAKLISFFREDLAKREAFIYSNADKNSRCYCGSDLLYRDCHGHDLANVYAHILSEVRSLVERYKSGS